MDQVNWQSMRVLIADDDATFRRLMEGLLGKLGCQVMFAKNGIEAVSLCRDHSFDICFMDIMMPDMGGIAAAQIIRDECTKTMPIIAITSSSMKATKEKCLDVGMQDFIVKPVSSEIIKESIGQYALKR